MRPYKEPAGRTGKPSSELLKGGYIGTIIGVIKWDTRSLDFGGFQALGEPVCFWFWTHKKQISILGYCGIWGLPIYGNSLLVVLFPMALCDSFCTTKIV